MADNIMICVPCLVKGNIFCDLITHRPCSKCTEINARRTKTKIDCQTLRDKTAMQWLRDRHGLDRAQRLVNAYWASHRLEGPVPRVQDSTVEGTPRVPTQAPAIQRTHPLEKRKKQTTAEHELQTVLAHVGQQLAESKATQKISIESDGGAEPAQAKQQLAENTRHVPHSVEDYQHEDRNSGSLRRKRKIDSDDEREYERHESRKALRRAEAEVHEERMMRLQAELAKERAMRLYAEHQVKDLQRRLAEVQTNAPVPDPAASPFGDPDGGQQHRRQGDLRQDPRWLTSLPIRRQIQPLPPPDHQTERSRRDSPGPSHQRNTHRDHWPSSRPSPAPGERSASPSSEEGGLRLPRKLSE